MLIRGALRHLRDRIVRPTDHGVIFSRIHRENVWGDAESASGPGSTRQRAADFLDDLLAALDDLEIRVLLDAACGDFNWAAPVADHVERYIGVDVVPALIAANRTRHGGPGREFLRRDLTREPLPAVDAVLCRDCLVHFSFADAHAALANLRRTGARYLIATTFVDRPRNAEARTGWWRVLNLEAPPFGFPPPMRVIDERCLGGAGGYRDKRLGIWTMASLPR
ncbi:MAG: class I SAM-dependent methyltransferase [Vicinamibacteraceae bacterium]